MHFPLRQNIISLTIDQNLQKTIYSVLYANFEAVYFGTFIKNQAFESLTYLFVKLLKHLQKCPFYCILP
jgi:hypothetical protein